MNATHQGVAFRVCGGFGTVIGVETIPPLTPDVVPEITGQRRLPRILLTGDALRPRDRSRSGSRRGFGMDITGH